MGQHLSCVICQGNWETVNQVLRKQAFNIESIHNLSVNIQELLCRYKYKLNLELLLSLRDSKLFCDLHVRDLYESVNHD